MFRESVLQAGIKGNQLIIALEAEAASMYCQELRGVQGNRDTLKTGMNFIMLDLAGN